MLASWEVFTGEPHACEDGAWTNKSAPSQFVNSSDQEKKILRTNDDGVAHRGTSDMA
jgi:hypothetical protein